MAASAKLLGTAAALALVGAGAAVAVTRDGGAAAPPRPSAAAPPITPPEATVTAAPETPTAPDVVMVRRAGGVPDAWAGRLRRMAGVGAVSRVTRAQALLRATRAAGDGRGRQVPAGYAVVLDTLVVEPRSYAAMLPATDARTFARLRPGAALLSRSSARVRRAGRGSTLTLAGGRRLRVVGIVDDGLVRSAELVVSRAEGRRLGPAGAYLLAAIRTPSSVRRASHAFDGARSVVADLGPAPWPVRGRIARPAALKLRFGEFAVREPVGADWIQPHPAWVRRNIVSRRVPVLGSVTCHRRMVPALRRAMAELVRRRLTRLVDPRDYAGCYAPRRIPGSGTLSLHAWGLAVDLNAGRNPQGSRPRQDRRLVAVMERHGFSWGGRWPTVPDGMHFEFHGDGAAAGAPL
ncbi:MAG: hypothetical protein QOD81_484 [Solirubrobacteraceae bacterium]|nr:hypothetical protein [Solirubrobacteraceae bacterium]